jgi:hypothetical protein
MFPEKKMKKIIAAFGLAGLLFYSPAAADPVTQQELFRSVSPVEKVSLVGAARLVDEDNVLGIVAFYDDPGTERPVDYMEVYDESGDLLAFGWFDRFGIERIAVDAGVLGSAEKPEGTYVILVDGQPL